MKIDDSKVIEETAPISVEVGTVVVQGDLGLPPAPAGVVLFAHGSGSSRKSPRNRQVARQLRHRGFGTLLLDLLTPDEEQYDMQTARWRFDIGLLARRLQGAIAWLRRQPRTKSVPVGLFGASTGAAAALVAAAALPDSVAAVVSRGGRPDLAGEALDRVRAPTLLIVGERDEAVLDLNEQALAHLDRAPSRLEVVAGATHLFEEPGAMDAVAGHAGDWFTHWLAEKHGQRENDRAA